MKQDEILSLIKSLRKSAQERGTEQGIEVYDLYIKDLEGQLSDSAMEQLLEDLSRTLAGIEAYGDLTDKELRYVKKLWGFISPIANIRPGWS